MPFSKDEIDELNAAIDEAYGFVALPFVLKRPSKATSTIDTLYGEARGTDKKFVLYTLHGSILQKPETKVLQKWGYWDNADLLISVTRAELRRVGIIPTVIDQIDYDGRTYFSKKVSNDTVLPIDDGTVNGTSDFLALVIIASTK